MAGEDGDEADPLDKQKLLRCSQRDLDAVQTVLRLVRSRKDAKEAQVLRTALRLGLQVLARDPGLLGVKPPTDEELEGRRRQS